MFETTEGQSYVSGNFNQLENPDEVLKRKQLETLKSLSNLLLREVESLEQAHDRAQNGRLSKHINLHEEVQRFEATMIRNALILTGGIQRKAARMLGLKTSTLNLKIKRYKIKMNFESEAR